MLFSHRLQANVTDLEGIIKAKEICLMKTNCFKIPLPFFFFVFFFCPIFICIFSSKTNTVGCKLQPY